MSASWKIDFGDTRIGLDQRANTFNHIKADVGDVLCP